MNGTPLTGELLVEAYGLDANEFGPRVRACALGEGSLRRPDMHGWDRARDITGPAPALTAGDAMVTIDRLHEIEDLFDYACDYAGELAGTYRTFLGFEVDHMESAVYLFFSLPAAA